MSGPVIFNGRRSKLLTADGILTSAGRTVDYNGDENYIANGHAEVNTTGWATYADAAGSVPVDGTGGSPNVTWTRSTTTPLAGQGSFIFTKDAANRQGQGASYDFSIDRAQQAKVLNISFDWSVDSGTYSGGSSSTNSDIIAYVYDVTNAVLIEPAPIKLDGAVSGTQYRFVSSFQTASNSTSYRLILHCSTTSASAYTLKMDNFFVSPSFVTTGAFVGDWTDYIATVAGMGTGSYTLNYSRWRRVGPNIEIAFRFTKDGSGGSGSTSISITQPSNIVISSAITQNYFGGSAGSGNTTNGNYEVYYDTSANNIKFLQNDSTNFVGSEWAASATVGGFISFPVQGWGTSQVLSSETDTRVVAAIITGDPASATSGNPIIVPTVSYDSHGAYNASTGRYTVQISGLYKMFGALQSASSATTLTIYKNAVSNVLAGSLDSNGEATFAGMVNCVAGDIIDIRPGGTVDATSMVLNVERLSGPSQIAASESVSLSARRTTSQSLTSATSTTLIFDTVAAGNDSHGSYNTSTGIYTVPISGVYAVDFNARDGSNTNAVAIGDVVAGGTTYRVFQHTAMPISTSFNGTWQGRLIAGQTIYVQYRNDSTTPAISTFANLHIRRVGN